MFHKFYTRTRTNTSITNPASMEVTVIIENSVKIEMTKEKVLSGKFLSKEQIGLFG